MSFKERILDLENIDINSTYIVKIGNKPVMLTAPHTMRQIKEDGTVKKPEPFTKAIALYVSEQVDCSHLIKLEDTGVDANSLVEEDFKRTLLGLIESNKIKLVIDIHGAKKEHNFDIEFGTLNNVSADYTTIKQLEDEFMDHGINNIIHNEPFKGGGITKYIYTNSDIDVIQIEINKNYRDFEKIENMEKICNALISFIEMYD